MYLSRCIVSAKLANDFLAVNFFCERNLPEKVDWVLNMPLMLSSNVICVVFIATLPHTHDGHTSFTSFPAGFTWSLSLVETAYAIVNMIQVINEEARAT